MFDIIGDIHGHAAELKLLLKKLGYEQHGDGFRHSDRQIIFVGDFVDRGPAIAEAIRIARATVDNGDGFAVMGNHEYNAIAFDTKQPSAGNDQYFRPHTSSNCQQHAATLNQLSSSELADAIAWFKTLPVTIERDGLRVVHAAWLPDEIAEIKTSQAKFGNFTSDFLAESEKRDTDLFFAIDNVLKGPTIPLPEGICFLDKAGHERKSVRIKWYESPVGKSYLEYHLGTDTIPDVPIPVTDGQVTDNPNGRIAPYSADQPPVFIGHYWLNSTPAPLASNVACTDFSVAKQGKLCAYRWYGESILTAQNFISVDAAT